MLSGRPYHSVEPGVKFGSRPLQRSHAIEELDKTAVGYSTLPETLTAGFRAKQVDNPASRKHGPASQVTASGDISRFNTNSNNLHKQPFGSVQLPFVTQIETENKAAKAQPYPTKAMLHGTHKETTNKLNHLQGPSYKLSNIPPSSASARRTLSPESSSFGSIARQSVWEKRSSRDRASVDSTASEPPMSYRKLSPRPSPQHNLDDIIECAPAKAKPFVGRANTVQLPMAKQHGPLQKAQSLPISSGQETNLFHHAPQKRTKPSSMSSMPDFITEGSVTSAKSLERSTKKSLPEKSAYEGLQYGSLTKAGVFCNQTAKNSDPVYESSSLKLERMNSYKDKRRKELAMATNLRKSGSIDLDKNNGVVTKLVSHVPNYSVPYTSTTTADVDQSLALPTHTIATISPRQPCAVPVATVSPYVPSFTSPVVSSSGIVSNNNHKAITTFASSVLRPKDLLSSGETRSAFKPVKSNSPTKFIPNSAPLTSMNTGSPENRLATAQALPVSTSNNQMFKANSASFTVATTCTTNVTQSTRSSTNSDTLPLSSTLTTSCITNPITSPTVLNKKNATNSSANNKTNKEGADTAAAQNSNNTAKATSPRGVTSKKLSDEQAIEEAAGELEAIKQFVLTSASKAKILTSGTHKANPERSYFDNRMPKDIERWEDLIMDVADMQMELEKIESKIRKKKKVPTATLR